MINEILVSKVLNTFALFFKKILSITSLTYLFDICQLVSIYNAKDFYMILHDDLITNYYLLLTLI